MSGKRVLVTGGAGYLGSHVVRMLKDVCNVTVYDNLLYTNEYLEDVSFINGDVTNSLLLKIALARADVVIWLAAIVGDAPCMVNPARAIATNQEAVRTLARFDGPIIFTSSCSVYGNYLGLAREDTQIHPLSLYAETKASAEEYLRDKNALILRMGTLHGTSRRMRFDLVVNTLTKKAVMDGTIQVFGGRQYRPLLAVQDAAEFIAVKALGSWKSGIYNLASENLSILEVARKVKDYLPSTHIIVLDSAYEDNRNYQADFSRAQDILGYHPGRSAKDSIADIAALVSSRRIKDLSDIRYANLMALQKGT